MPFGKGRRARGKRARGWSRGHPRTRGNRPQPDALEEDVSDHAPEPQELEESTTRTRGLDSVQGTEQTTPETPWPRATSSRYDRLSETVANLQKRCGNPRATNAVAGPLQPSPDDNSCNVARKRQSEMSKHHSPIDMLVHSPLTPPREILSNVESDVQYLKETLKAPDIDLDKENAIKAMVLLAGNRLSSEPCTGKESCTSDGLQSHSLKDHVQPHSPPTSSKHVIVKYPVVQSTQKVHEQDHSGSVQAGQLKLKSPPPVQRLMMDSSNPKKPTYILIERQPPRDGTNHQPQGKTSETQHQMPICIKLSPGSTSRPTGDAGTLKPKTTGVRSVFSNSGLDSAGHGSANGSLGSKRPLWNVDSRDTRFKVPGTPKSRLGAVRSLQQDERNPKHARKIRCYRDNLEVCVDICPSSSTSDDDPDDAVSCSERLNVRPERVPISTLSTVACGRSTSRGSQETFTRMCACREGQCVFNGLPVGCPFLWKAPNPDRRCVVDVTGDQLEGIAVSHDVGNGVDDRQASKPEEEFEQYDERREDHTYAKTWVEIDNVAGDRDRQVSDTGGHIKEADTPDNSDVDREGSNGDEDDPGQETAQSVGERYEGAVSKQTMQNTVRVLSEILGVDHKNTHVHVSNDLQRNNGIEGDSGPQRAVQLVQDPHEGPSTGRHERDADKTFYMSMKYFKNLVNLHEKHASRHAQFVRLVETMNTSARDLFVGKLVERLEASSAHAQRSHPGYLDRGPIDFYGRPFPLEREEKVQRLKAVYACKVGEARRCLITGEDFLESFEALRDKGAAGERLDEVAGEYRVHRVLHDLVNGCRIESDMFDFAIEALVKRGTSAQLIEALRVAKRFNDVAYQCGLHNRILFDEET